MKKRLWRIFPSHWPPEISSPSSAETAPGKSTLFNAVAGVFYVDEGRVILDGEDMTFLPEYKRSNHLGRLFQDPLKGPRPT